MRFSAAAAAAAVLAIAPSVAADGSYVIKNYCSFPAYVWSCSDELSPMTTLQPHGGVFSEDYSAKKDGGGLSIKLARNNSDGTLVNGINILQFEYTVSNKLWYDLSVINGNPWEQDGFALIPTDTSCRPAMCSGSAGDSCKIYHFPTEDRATSACDLSSDITVELCPSVGADITPIGSAPAAQAPATATSAAPSVPATSVAPAYTPASSSYSTEASVVQVSNVVNTPAAAPPSPTYGEPVTYPQVGMQAVEETQWVTTLLTQTVVVRDAAPTDPIHGRLKRHAHHPAHEHAAAQQ